MKNRYALGLVAALAFAGAGCSKKSTTPAPAAVKPAEPAPEAPKPAEPAPEAPKPAEPAPEAPKPAEPAPEAPKPAEPAPEAPKPAEPAPEAPATDRAAAVIRGIELASQGKYDESLADWADTAVWHSVGRPELVGKAAILAEMAEGRKAFPDLQLKPTWIFDAGETVVAITVLRGTNSGPLGTAPATGKTVGIETAVVFHFGADGKVDRATEFFDEQKVAAQLGVIPGAEGQPVPPVLELPTAEPTIVKGAANEANLVTAKAIMDAFKKDTFAAKLRETLTADFTMTDPMTGGTIAGAEASITALEKGLFAMWPDYSGTATWTGSVGEWVITVLDNQGTYKGGIPGVEAKDQVSKFKSLDLMLYEGGKVKTYKSFANGMEIMAALMPAPAAPAEGEKPAEGAAPAEGEKPAEGAAAPAAGEKPAEGAAPAEGEKPAEGAAAPAAGEKPAEGAPQ